MTAHDDCTCGPCAGELQSMCSPLHGRKTGDMMVCGNVLLGQGGRGKGSEGARRLGCGAALVY